MRGRRRRNSPWGATSGEYRHAGWANPRRRRNPRHIFRDASEFVPRRERAESDLKMRERSQEQARKIIDRARALERSGGVRRNPGRRRGPRRDMGRTHISGKGAILLGHLTEIVLDGGDKVAASALRGCYVAWLPARKDLVVVHKVNARPGRVDRSALMRHRKFHGADARTMATFDLPEQRGRRQDVGLIQSLTYVVPEDVNSPEKQKIQWFHKFGDHGESGHGPVGEEKTYPTRLMPLLQVDQGRNLVIKRRPGNKYKVTDWIFW